MPTIDTGALEFAVDLARPMVEQTRAAPGQSVPVPKELSAQLNAVLSNAMLEDVLALRERERTVPVENLRLTVRCRNKTFCVQKCTHEPSLPFYRLRVDR